MGRIAGLDLQGDVADAEAFLQVVADPGQQAVISGAGTDQVGRIGHLGRAHRPDVQVVHFGDAGQPGKIAIDLA